MTFENRDFFSVLKKLKGILEKTILLQNKFLV